MSSRSTSAAAGHRPTDRRGRPRRLSPAWWLSERRRGYAAAVVSFLAIVPAVLLAPENSPETIVRSSAVRMVVILVAYLVIYVLLTLLALSRTPWADVAAWAERSTEPTWRSRLLRADEPGVGLAVTVSTFALVGTVVVARSDDLTPTVAPWTLVTLSAALIVLSWVTLLLTFTVSYVCLDARRGWGQLGFPGEGERTTADYVYFAVTVSTTFGTSDVDVRTSRMRREVVAHSVVAFAFNTVIIALTLSLLFAQ